jgi:hypothetical protein
VSVSLRGARVIGRPAASAREVWSASSERSKTSPGCTDGSRWKRKTASGPSAELTEAEGDWKVTLASWLSGRALRSPWVSASFCGL